MRLATVGDVAAVMAWRYDPATAESWDSVGLACGDPDEAAGSVLLAVDPVAEVLDEAIAGGHQMLITHHPLLLTGVHGVPACDAKGRIVHRAIRAGVALYAAHTNADHANPGVSDAICTALGLVDAQPLEPLAGAGAPMDKYLVMVPRGEHAVVLDAMADAGAGHIGNYDRAAFTTEGTGTFRPLPGANPTIGAVGQVETVPEVQIHMIAPRSLRAAVVAALVAAHPYEEPAYDILELAAPPSTLGAGRVGLLPDPMTLWEFAALVARTLPATAHGVRVAGDANSVIRRVALCGGSGDSLLRAATASGADVYLTSDLRHHRASEHLQAGGPALVDVAHWAAEWMWLPQAAELLVADMKVRGFALDVAVSRTVTDPWTAHLQSARSGNHAAQPGAQEDT